jgi:DNA-directed RNA polymerase subunit F
MEIIKEVLVTDAEAKKILEKRAKSIELGYEQKNALEHLRKFVKIPEDKAKEIIKELEKIERLRPRERIMIANLLPEDRDDLRVILQKDYTNFSEDEINLILETIKKNI